MTLAIHAPGSHTVYNMQPENTIKCTCTALLSCVVSFIPLYGHCIAMHLVHKSPTDAHVYVHLTYIIPYYYTITDTTGLIQHAHIGHNIIHIHIKLLLLALCPCVVTVIHIHPVQSPPWLRVFEI